MATGAITTSSEAIVVGEGWISEHFFTTTSTKESFNALVRERRKSWDQAAKDDGEETPRTRFTSARTALLDAMVRLEPDSEIGAAELHKQLLEILGYNRAGLVTTQNGPVRLIRDTNLATTGLAVVEAMPATGVDELLTKDANNLLTPFTPDEKTEITSVARLISWLFLDDDHKPPFILVLAGGQCLIAERDRWPEGRYLAINLQLVAERNDATVGGEIDRALTCLAAESLAPNAEGKTWWTDALDKSVQHTVGVSQDLRDGVRFSIELIANEVVDRRRAEGLDPLPDDQAQPLAKQSLRFLYRILFLLYAEASPELGVLPSGAQEYDAGYSIDRLRELILVDLPTPRAQSGTHLYQSLAVLFDLIDQGHDGGDPNAKVQGLTFRSLKADLFQPAATALIDEVGLGNAALQQVLQHLLLSKKAGKGRDRGFISYAELGINQLGAVYEGLMSYTGRFAETDLYEVAKGGNPEKGSWLVPVSRAETISKSDFVRSEDEVTGEIKPVIHAQGSFVFRLAGRERQQSASYYTPEALTRFTVSQALEELLDQDGHTTTAAEILELTICEPALGSGAFAIEAVRQLAEEYLKRRQAELGVDIDPDEYPRELQKVKAHLALHQVYGVDLNATAVELAEISLWLDTMVEGLAAPWFGLRLKRGNSLIGARRSGYPRFKVESKEKEWLKAAPIPIPSVVGHVENTETGRLIHHFLLPADGWGSTAEVGKEIRDLVPEAVKDLKDWRRGTKARPSKKQIDGLIDLGIRVERLWQLATRRLEIAEEQVRRDIPLWGGHPLAVEPGEATFPQPSVTRETIEASLADEDGAYRRLRRVMDAWCALWFWPLTETNVKPPTLERWYDALAMILGTTHTMSKKYAANGDETLDSLDTWDELENAEHDDRVYSRSTRVADVLTAHPWLKVCEDVARAQGFFHWDLDFATVFTNRGGFDLQVGNPPWVRPTVDVPALLAEADPWWKLSGKATQSVKNERRARNLKVPGMRPAVIDGASDVTASTSYLSATAMYPFLKGLQPDLYRCFMDATWRHRSQIGVAALIHPETHFTDDKAGPLRSETYRRLRRHWQFINELSLFEVHHLVSYGVHVYGARFGEPSFIQSTSLYHPDTVEKSFVHDGMGEEPGQKDESGNWDVRPHRGRIIRVDSGRLKKWNELLEGPETPVLESRTLYAGGITTNSALEALGPLPRISGQSFSFSMGWHEVDDKKAGIFDTNWGHVDSWDQAILMGPHVHVGLPFYKTPNPTMKNNQDWTRIDLEHLSDDELPVTGYKPTIGLSRFKSAFGRWGSDREILPLAHPRVFWRSMAATTGERTLIPAILPPGPAHLKQNIYALGVPGRPTTLVQIAGVMSSIVSDSIVRAVPKSSIPKTLVGLLPFADGPVSTQLILRALRLNCLTDAYADLWAEVMADEQMHIAMQDAWTGGLDYPGRPALGDLSRRWTGASPLRRASDRRQALVEIDALVALMLGVSAEELCTIYRTQFAVLYGYDRTKYIYDANGREVPNSVLSIWRKKGDRITAEERTATHPGSGIDYSYELPFRTLDREADMRRAYAHFEEVMHRG